MTTDKDCKGDFHLCFRLLTSYTKTWKKEIGKEVLLEAIIVGRKSLKGATNLR